MVLGLCGGGRQEWQHQPHDGVQQTRPGRDFPLMDYGNPFATPLTSFMCILRAPCVCGGRQTLATRQRPANATATHFFLEERGHPFGIPPTYLLYLWRALSPSVASTGEGDDNFRWLVIGQLPLPPTITTLSRRPLLRTRFYLCSFTMSATGQHIVRIYYYCFV